jgi:hypothetical protein
MRIFPIDPLIRRRASMALLALCFLPLGGCITHLLGLGGEPSVEGEKGSTPLAKLERIVFNFADRDVTLVSDVCDAIKREAPTVQVQRSAQSFKVANGTAVYDIVTSPNSLGHLVDLYVMIHLQHLALVDEGNGDRLFGEKGAAHLTEALGQLRNEIDRLVELTVKSKRKEELNRLVERWRRSNPDIESVSGIRFGHIPELSGKSILEAIPSLFDVVNPMDEASRSVDESRQLAERAFFFSKRLPKLLDWQADSALDDLMTHPEVQQILKDVTQTSGSVDRVRKVLERVPDLVATERKEFLAAWDARQGEAVSTLKELRMTLGEGREFAAQVSNAGQSFERTFDALNRIVEPARERSLAEGSKPFDINEYTTAATEIAMMSRAADALMVDGQSLLASPAWGKRQEELKELASATIDHLVWRMTQVLLAFFGLLILYKVLLRRIDRKQTAGSGSQADATPENPLRAVVHSPR